MSVQLSRAEVGRVFAALWALTALAAVVAVAVPGLASGLRGWFAFEPGRSGGQLAAVWVANVRVVGFVLLAAVAVGARWPVRMLDALVAVVLGGNVVLVGLAIGAHGPALAPWLAHLPLEWAGLAVALAAYLSARRTPSCLRTLLRAAGLSAGLLALAAAVEVWATPLRWS
jgi:hypothetical protein